MRNILHSLPVLPRTMWYAMLVGLVIHVGGLAYVLMHVSEPDVLVWGDGTRYVELAERLASGDGFTYLREGTPIVETFRTPGLPFLIAFFLKIGLGFGGYLFALTIVSALAIPLLTWLIFRDLLPSRVVLIASWLATLEPLMWLNSWFALSEIPFVVISLLGLYLLKLAWVKNDWYFALLAGMTLGLSLLVRPAVVPLYGAVFLGLLGYSLAHRYARAATLGIVGAALVLTLLPWLMWMHAQTGVYALSGVGWRNVYTDYLASVYAIESGTSFANEKTKLKKDAMARWGLSLEGLDNPANAPLFRNYALQELAQHKSTVVKIQAITFISYFTHTDYLYRLARLKLMPTVPSQLSASQVLVREGIAGIPKVAHEMSRKFFMPVFERVWTAALFACAVYGAWLGRRIPLVWVIVVVIGIGYVTSSAIGTGVEGRLRIPILPYYFVLVGMGASAAYDYFRRRRRQKL